MTDALAAALGVPAHVGNDVQVATNAEFALGAGKEYRSILGVFWGTGRRRRHRAGRQAVDGARLGRPRSATWSCARTGAGVPAGGAAAWRPTPAAPRWRRAPAAQVKRGKRTMLFDIMEERGRDRLTSGMWERALHKGDPLATRLMDRAIRALGTGVGSALNVLDVEAVVIGGGLGVRLGPMYLERITAEIMTHAVLADARRTCGSPSWATWAGRSARRCSRKSASQSRKPRCAAK